MSKCSRSLLGAISVDYTVSITAIPEQASAALLGLLGLAGRRRARA
jgi:hypothetical protein